MSEDKKESIKERHDRWSQLTLEEFLREPGVDVLFNGDLSFSDRILQGFFEVHKAEDYIMYLLSKQRVLYMRNPHFDSESAWRHINEHGEKQKDGSFILLTFSAREKDRRIMRLNNLAKDILERDKKNYKVEYIGNFRCRISKKV